MTQTIALSSATTAVLPPCPVWCTEHYGITHTSEWLVWQAGDSPHVWLQMARHDETDSRTGEHLIGQIDFTMQISKRYGCYCMDGEVADGFLSCSEMRELSKYLANLADQADPDGLNGIYHLETEWLLTPNVRRGHTTAMPVPDGKARPLCLNGDA